MIRQDLALGTRSKSFISAAFHVFGAVAIVYFFLVVLMTASAQSRVADRLSKLPSPVDYSTGYAMWYSSRSGDPILEGLKGRENTQILAIATANESSEIASDAYYSLTAQIHSILHRMSIIKNCDVNDREFKIDDVPSIIGDIDLCARNTAVPISLRAAAAQFLEEAKPSVAMALGWRKASRQVAALNERLSQTRGSISARQKEWLEAKPIRDCFSELNVLGKSWLIGGGLLIEFPPAMIQIVLAFFSGLFGGLLLTLVLVVYPHNELREVIDPTNVGARICLGGLISLCVFIVLGGGSAVMGTASAFADGEANFLAFCAIGILAGMFSDRVAFWLSERADTFFRKSSTETK